MNVAAAEAIANVISENELRPDYIIPSVFDRRVVQAVAAAVSQTAIQTGVARRQPIAIDSSQTDNESFTFALAVLVLLDELSLL